MRQYGPHLDRIAATFCGVSADHAESRDARGADRDAAPKSLTHWRAVIS
jgi:hypothetical protein